jgi:hypothetical protein
MTGFHCDDRFVVTWRMPSSGMWRRVDLVWTDVSEEFTASIFRVEKSASDGPVWAGGSRLSHQSKTHIPEDGILHIHRRANLNSYFLLVYVATVAAESGKSESWVDTLTALWFPSVPQAMESIIFKQEIGYCQKPSEKQPNECTHHECKI